MPVKFKTMDYQKICKNCSDKQGWHYLKSNKKNPRICRGFECTCKEFKE